jgi:hypothetical protein
MPAVANDLNPGGALPELVRLGRDLCGDLEQAERRECVPLYHSDLNESETQRMAHDELSDSPATRAIAART